MRMPPVLPLLLPWILIQQVKVEADAWSCHQGHSDAGVCSPLNVWEPPV